MLLIPAILTLVVAVFSLLWLAHEQQLRSSVATVLGGVIVWGGVAFGLHLTQTGQPVVVQIGWSAGVWLLMLGGLGVPVSYGLLPFILLVGALGVVMPQILIPLLAWGGVTLIPTVTLAFVWHKRGMAVGRFISAPVSAPYLPNPSPSWQLSLLECLSEGVVVSNYEGQIIFVNQPAAKIIGVPVAELMGQSVMDVLARLPMLSNSSGFDKEDENTLQLQFEMNGRLIQGQMSVVYDTAGRPQNSVAVLQDITETFQSQRAKATFLTNISHELRTPLTAIQGYSELLSSEVAGKLNDQQKLFLETIQRNVSRMVKLINSLIFVSSVKSGRLETRSVYTDMKQIVNQIVRELEPTARMNQQKIVTEFSANLTPIQADTNHVSTMIHELASNSVKYNRPGGTVAISVHMEFAEQPDNQFIVVRISDDGVGIDPIDQLHIFDDFFRAEQVSERSTISGMGVGLAIVRALVEAYNGRIWFDSQLGQGTTFSFILPVKQLASPAASVSAGDI